MSADLQTVLASLSAAPAPPKAQPLRPLEYVTDIHLSRSGITHEHHVDPDTLAHAALHPEEYCAPAVVRVRIIRDADTDTQGMNTPSDGWRYAAADA